ncbi:hypothetical protein ACHQM5_004267 [Ranunculus cassubicifolius]
MAEAILSVVLDQLASILRVQVEQEVRLVVGVDKDVKDLTESLAMVRAVLQDAEKKQVTSKAVKVWLQDLKDIMYDADDVADEWRTRIEISKLQNSDNTADGVPDKVRSYLSSLCSCFQPVIVRHEIAYKIIDIRERLVKNKRSIDQLKLVQTKDDNHQPRKFTSSSLEVSEIKGRDSDKQVIVGRLFAESSTSTSVLAASIVGMGGLGKTALARFIYNDEELMQKFDLKMWVCVSEPFEREKLAKEIIQEATKEEQLDFTSWERLHKRLTKAVEGKRFLLVIDDIWTTNYDDWHPFKLSLERGASGSRVLVTTRDRRVAKMIGSSYIHELGLLADDDCWSLFRQVALPQVQPLEEHAQEFEEFKDEIVDKCKGVPLTAKALGGLMRLKQTKQEWRDVLASHVWKQAQDERGGFFPAILLSYQDLPSHLKQCFMYTAIFEKDTLLEKEMLVKLWMAQGFLDLDGYEELEMIGGMYFTELAMRSFLQDFKKDVNGNIVMCKMHDLVHDFSQSLTKTDCSILENNGVNFSYNNVRHLYAKSLENPDIYKGEKLRTLICPGFSKSNLSEIFDHLKCLRTLDVSFSSIKELPEAVERLLHLRYLDLSYNYDLKELPETVCNLYNLQTLKLNHCFCFTDLPKGIGGLLNLRHLELENTNILNCIPESIGKLSRLRTLSKFMVCEGCTIQELGSLNHLRGHLSIDGLGRVENEEDAKRAQLQKKQNLRSLQLLFQHGDDPVRMEGVLKSLQPHKNLEKLFIWRYSGTTFPLWMSMCDSALPNLVELGLHNWENCGELPPALGKLKYLQTLSMYGLSLVKVLSAQHLGISTSGGSGASSSSSSIIVLFPKLRELRLYNMYEWEGKIEEATSALIMPCLHTLEIIDCPKLKVVPHYMFSPSLKELKLSECPLLAEGMQPCLPLQLEKMILEGGVGVFSRSLLPESSSHNIYPNLKTVKIFYSRHSSLPQGLNNFKSLQDLEIMSCKLLDLMPEELIHFPLLRVLDIANCPIVEERCSREDWRVTLSNVPYKIIISHIELTQG